MSARRLGKLNRLFDWTPILGKSTVLMFFCFLGGHNKSCSVRLKYNGDHHCNRPVKDLDFIEPELEHGVRVVLQCVPHVPKKYLSLSQATHISLSQVPAAVECHYEQRPIFDLSIFCVWSSPLSPSSEFSENWRNLLWPSGGSERLCSQITDPAFSSSEVAHCQTRALLSVSSWQHAPKCCQVLSELEQGGESPI